MTDHRLHTIQMPAYLDKEVSSADHDKFGHAHLATALRGLVEDEKHRPPYSIGLLGKWGTGKSTVKSLYLDHLSTDETTNGAKVKRRNRIHTITFNAWKYGGESDIRKSLFRHIFLEIGGTHGEADRHLFKTVSSTESQRRTLKEVLSDFVDQYVLGLLVVGVFAVLFVALLSLMAWGFGFDDPATAAASLLASSGIVGVLAQKYFSSLPMLSARTPVNITSSPIQTIEEFEELFLTQIRKFKKGDKKNVRRIVVFIDDLDRLTADEMVSGLDGIRSLIEMASHEMPGDIGIVFVISCDEERVADALSKRRATADLPAAVSNIQDARRYLDRIFQFRLEIPPFPKRDMRSFALGLLETEYPALLADLKERGIDLQELVDRMIHPAVQSPRNAIQIVNLFAQSWWLSTLRERSAVGADNPGGLGEGVVTKNPLTLAIICVIRTDFPDFYQVLQKNPRVFDYFIDRFIRPEPLQPLPAEVHEQLAEFSANHSSEGEEKQDGRWDVKPQHRGLRQFMSHIQDIRRPYSLQPLLTLSQDPVSRQHGDKAVPIEEALRTSDVVALLDAAGLTGSTGTFPPDFGALLADLIDDLRSETPTIQDNAAFTVAQLDERIPENDKRRILGLAVRRAANSESLRWRLGPSKLHALTLYAENEELRALGRTVIEDITAAPTNVRLPSLETPSLREGRDLTQSAADLVITLMQQATLPPQSQSAFGQWLVHRTVKITGQSDQLSLSWLEDKLAAHEDILLPLLHEDYPEIIAEEFSKEEPEALDLATVTERLDSLFTSFFDRGTQTRERLWKYLTDFAALSEPSLVALAFTKFADWHDYADASAAQSVFSTMGARLVHYEEDAKAWPLVDEQALRDIFTGRAEERESFDNDSIAYMVQLAKEWSQPSRQAATSASRLYAVLENADPAQWTALSQDWAKRFFADLPAACQQALLVTANSEDAPDEPRTTLASSIGPLRGSTLLDKHKIEAFSRLISMMDQAVLQASPFVEHVGQFIDDTVNLAQQSAGDPLVSKIEALAGNLEKLPPTKAQQLLNSFVQLQSQPTTMAGVYDVMREKWPLPSAEGGFDYAAQELFKAGINVFPHVEKSGNEAANFLESLDSLHHRARLEQLDNEDKLVACAYQLWAYDPRVSEMVFRRYPEADRTSEQLTELVGTIVEDNDGDADRSRAALVQEIECADAETIQTATMSLLAQPPQEADGSPDPVLALWANAVSEHDPKPLLDALVSESTNDEQAVRLYHCIRANIKHISEEQFITLLQQILSVQEGRDKTADSLVRSLEDLMTEKFKTEDQRRALCEGVLSVFSEVTKLNRKAQLAKVCRPAGLKNVVLDAGYIDSMPDDDLQIIEKSTGKIRK
ncbi:KAP family NTPase [Halomonas denitrificans]|uniref:KAP family P-loop NTPase fold protein n=1 Tax=Halomonas denitrificans TaxID=370769 RepID=UPI001CD2A16A|nr:P-loop NTPase fold protein [Halomonas denitrificans]MCA0974757.1 KAP family NTPase [Halomonas denitrificans]